MLRTARRLVDSIYIAQYMEFMADVWDFEAEPLFGVDNPIQEAFAGRNLIQTKELPHLTGATRTGWAKLLLAILNSTLGPPKTWTAEAIEAALIQLETAFEQESGRTNLESKSSVQQPGESAVEAAVVGLTPGERAAYEGYKQTEREIGKKCTDRQAYDWLNEQIGHLEKLPRYETWRRYLRRGRKRLNEQKNRPRAGRTGRSIVDQDGEDRFSEE